MGRCQPGNRDRWRVSGFTLRLPDAAVNGCEPRARVCYTLRHRTGRLPIHYCGVFVSMPDLFRRKPAFNQKQTGEAGPVVPDGLWAKCPGCNELVYSRDYDRWFKVCPKCDHHARLTAGERVDYLLDSGSFTEWDTSIVTADPLEFSANGDRYADKVKQASQKSGQPEALVTGSGKIRGFDVVVAVTEFGFLGASMGSAFGEKFVRAVERAITMKLPFISVSSSGGARMHESSFSLMQWPRQRLRWPDSAIANCRI
jgi:acetyl-CoA carboxylase carboxyl transferase subunit beta